MDLEPAIRTIGTEIHDALPRPSRNPVKVVDARAMEMASRDEELRSALFRLVDVTPACRSTADLSRHLTAYLEEVPDRPPALDAALRAAHAPGGARALGRATAVGVRHMAHRFIAGETPKKALGEFQRLWEAGVASSVDLLGEATVTSSEADHYAARCRDALDTVAPAAARWPARESLERDSLGPIARANVSVKISALTPHMRPEAPHVGREDAGARLRPLLRRAKELGAYLHIDMESVDSLETTFDLIFGVLGEDEFRDGPEAGLVLQAYLRESPQQLERVLDFVRGAGRTTPLTVRLVKGAYWDHELVEARQHGWSVPVFEVKADSDRNFEALTRELLQARAGGDGVRVAVASHNLRSVAHAIACNRALGGADGDVELQVLRGLGDELQHSLSANGLRVRAYCPVGDLVAGMAYLVRRLLENTSNDSFLGDQQRGVPIGELLAAP
ncbi:MAG TPA: proline dehydrogenase family protein [Thermoleophilaceae bacterium]|nr:proline dehydrogenase family protein [Thermoleophilaceae bacterium]